MSKAGIVILPPSQELDEAIHQENDEMLDKEPAPLKWPRKPGMPNYDVFESEDSWYDSPPEDFNMTVSCSSNLLPLFNILVLSSYLPPPPHTHTPFLFSFLNLSFCACVWV